MNQPVQHTSASVVTVRLGEMNVSRLLTGHGGGAVMDAPVWWFPVFRSFWKSVVSLCLELLDK